MQTGCKCNFYGWCEQKSDTCEYDDSGYSEEFGQCGDFEEI